MLGPKIEEKTRIMGGDLSIGLPIDRPDLEQGRREPPCAWANQTKKREPGEPKETGRKGGTRDRKGQFARNEGKNARWKDIIRENSVSSRQRRSPCSKEK